MEHAIRHTHKSSPFDHLHYLWQGFTYLPHVMQHVRYVQSQSVESNNGRTTQK